MSSIKILPLTAYDRETKTADSIEKEEATYHERSLSSLKSLRTYRSKNWTY